MSRKKPDPAQQELARAQADASQRQMNLQEQMFQRALGLQEEDGVRSARQLALNEEWQREALADRDFFRDRWDQTTRRQEDEFFRQVDEFDTESNRRQLAAQGLADVQAQLGRARRDTGMALRRRGVDPGSARAIGAMAGMDIDEAAAGASAFNTALTAARREGLDLRRVAAGITNPLGTSQQFQANASNFGGISLDMGARGLNWFTGQAQGAGRMANDFASGANSAFESVNRQRNSGFNWEQALVGGLTGYIMSGGNPAGAAAGAAGGGMKKGP